MDAAPDQCPRCGAKLKGLKPRKTHQKVVIDLEEAERGLVGTRTLWNVHWIPAQGAENWSQEEKRSTRRRATPTATESEPTCSSST